MSRLRVRAAAGPLRGEARVPGDKSIGHRAVLFAALASGRSRIRGLSRGEDNRRTVDALRALGVSIEALGEGELDVAGVGIDGLRATAGVIDCGNSGTTIRLLSGALAPFAFATSFDGDGSLRSRPMGRVATPLRAMGARIDGAAGKKAGDIYPPLVIGPVEGALRGIEYRSPIASAQVKSAIMLAALSAEGPTRIIEPARSRDHSERMLRSMGAPIAVEETTVVIDPRGWDRRLAARDVTVPGDLSASAFLIGAALIVPGSEIVIRGVGVNPTRTGLLDALAAMGADVTIENARDEGGEPVADLRARASTLHGARIEGELTVRAIDEIPLLAALAVHADGETTIADAGELRVKESDRIAAMVAALRAFGATVDEREDGMVIRGRQGKLGGARIASHSDHRIAMSSAICALAATGETIIDDTDNVATSFPDFHGTLGALGADIAAEATTTDGDSPHRAH